MLKERYSSFNSGQGKAFEEGDLSLEKLSEIAINGKHIERISGKQERFENIINQFI